MKTYNHKLVFASACFGMLLFGVTLTTLGSILPEIIPRFGISKTDAGSLFTIMNFGILLGSLFFGPIVDRYGYKKLMVACTTLLLIGIEGVAFSSTVQLFTVFIFFFGLGGGIINGATNAMVSDISQEGRSAGLALLGVFFGIGAFGVPLVLGSLLDIFTYTQLISSLGIIVGLALFMFIIVKFPAPKQPHSFPIKEAIKLVKHPTLLLLAFMLFFQSGMEIMTGGWTASFFNEVLQVDSSGAVFLLSFFWIGLMLSRLMLSKLLKNYSPGHILKISIGIAFIGSFTLLFISQVTVATMCVFIIGAGFGAGYPVVLGYIGDLYPKMSGTAYSLALTIALIGGMLLPYLAGIIGDIFGLRTSFLIIPVSLIAMFIMFLIVLRRFSQHHKQINP